MKLQGYENQEVRGQEQRCLSQQESMQENLLLFNFHYFVTLKLEEIKRPKTTKKSFEVAQLRFRERKCFVLFFF